MPAQREVTQIETELAALRAGYMKVARSTRSTRAINMRLDAIEAQIKPRVAELRDVVVTVYRFPEASCSCCGRTFGPGNHGFSHCESHVGL